jgi:hypothetical protein
MRASGSDRGRRPRRPEPASVARRDGNERNPPPQLRSLPARRGLHPARRSEAASLEGERTSRWHPERARSRGHSALQSREEPTRASRKPGFAHPIYAIAHLRFFLSVAFGRRTSRRSASSPCRPTSDAAPLGPREEHQGAGGADQGQPRQVQLRLAGRRQHAAPVGRVVPHLAGHRHGDGSVHRCRPGFRRRRRSWISCTARS